MEEPLLKPERFGDDVFAGQSSVFGSLAHWPSVGSALTPSLCVSPLKVRSQWRCGMSGVQRVRQGLCPRRPPITRLEAEHSSVWYVGSERGGCHRLGLPTPPARRNRNTQQPKDLFTFLSFITECSFRPRIDGFVFCFCVQQSSVLQDCSTRNASAVAQHPATWSERASTADWLVWMGVTVPMVCSGLLLGCKT